MIKKSENVLNEEKVKITKREHAFKDYASTYKVEILKSSELKFKDSASAIKSKLIELLTQLKGFKFATTLVLVLKNIESEDKIKHENLYSSSQKQK